MAYNTEILAFLCVLCGKKDFKGWISWLIN